MFSSQRTLLERPFLIAKPPRKLASDPTASSGLGACEAPETDILEADLQPPTCFLEHAAASLGTADASGSADCAADKTGTGSSSGVAVPDGAAGSGGAGAASAALPPDLFLRRARPETF